jgi:hypothetical protein
MQRFTSQDLQRNTARVQEAAMREAVTVSYHGRNRRHLSFETSPSEIFPA